MQQEHLPLTRITYTSNNKNLEGIFCKAEQDNSPLVVYIHGHNTHGAWETMFGNYLLVKEGFSVLAFSQQGYGLSEGKPDYCGPETVNGIVGGIEQFLQEYPEYKDKMAIWGRSRGATVAAQVLVQRPTLFKAGVLESGAYDLEKDFNDPNKIAGIKENMQKEIQDLDAGLGQRSVIHTLEMIETPLLILHGENDTNVNVEQARMLANKLSELNKPYQLEIIEKADHFITKTVRRKYVFPFLYHTFKLNT